MPIDWSILRSNGPVDVAGNFATGYKTGRAIVDDIHERNALAQYAASPGDPQARAALYRVNPELAARLEKRDEDRSDFQREGEARSALAGYILGPNGLPSPRGLTGVQPSALTGEMPSEPAPAPAPRASVMGYESEPNAEGSTFGKRVDGTVKGMGFLGALKRPDGNVSTEISVGVNMGGKETEIPLMVPGLAKSELDYLMTNDPSSPDFQKNMPRSILDKAVAHAKDRVANGLSPFRQDNEGQNGDIVVTGQRPQAQGHLTEDGLIRQPPMSDSWRKYVQADPEGAMKTLLTRANLGKDQALALAGQMDWMGRLAAGVTDQASYDQAKSVAQAQGFDTSHLPDAYSPQVVSVMQAQAMSAKDYLKQQHDFTDDEIDNAEVERHHKADEELTARGQDIRSSDTQRGQDLTSSDRQRGQNIESSDRQRGQDLSSRDRQRGQNMRGRGRGRGGDSGNTAVIVNPKTGQRMKLVDGKWVPA